MLSSLGPSRAKQLELQRLLEIHGRLEVDAPRPSGPDSGIYRLTPLGRILLAGLGLVALGGLALLVDWLLLDLF